MTNKFISAADESLDEAAEAAKLVLAERLAKEAATCDMKTLAQILEVADLLRSRRSHAEADATRQNALEALAAKIPMFLDQVLSMMRGTVTASAPRACRS